MVHVVTTIYIVPLDPVDVILFTVGMSVSAEAYDSLWLHVHVCTVHVPTCTVFHGWVLRHCVAHWSVLSHCCHAFHLVVTCSMRSKAITDSYGFLKAV